MNIPVYILIDNSEAMAGEPIKGLINGIQVLISSLRLDPMALETVDLVLLSLSDDAEIIYQAGLADFEMPNIEINGEPFVGKGANAIIKMIDEAKILNKWIHPYVLIFISETSKDDFQKSVENLKRIAERVVFITIGSKSYNYYSKFILNDLYSAEEVNLKIFNNIFDYAWVERSVSRPE